MHDPVPLLQKLLRCPSVTPQEGGALELLEKFSREIGFTVERVVFQDDGTPDVDNLYASIGHGTPHLVFAGHTDVVPPGDEQSWHFPPFSGEIVDGVLYGRGAVDMKGGIAAFFSAAARYLSDPSTPFTGRLSFLITGDEEGPAINGTVKLLKWAHEKGEIWDGALVGEPTNPEILGEMIKIGRRGSLSGILTIIGKQGHVAYPHLAANPLSKLPLFITALKTAALDTGSQYFQPSNLELTSIDTGNPSANVIPSQVRLCFNIRFNDLWTPEKLKMIIHDRLKQAVSSQKKIRAETKQNMQENIAWRLEWLTNLADVFITDNKILSSQLEKAIMDETGRKPVLSTSGGTSDARFIKNYCPVVEFGLVGQTMHQINECVPVTQLKQLSAIYERFLRNFFSESS